MLISYLTFLLTCNVFFFLSTSWRYSSVQMVVCFTCHCVLILIHPILVTLIFFLKQNLYQHQTLFSSVIHIMQIKFHIFIRLSALSPSVCFTTGNLLWKSTVHMCVFFSRNISVPTVSHILPGMSYGIGLSFGCVSLSP